MQVVPRATAGSPLNARTTAPTLASYALTNRHPRSPCVFGGSPPRREGKRPARPLRSASKRTKIDRRTTQPTTPPGCCGQPIFWSSTISIRFIIIFFFCSSSSSRTVPWPVLLLISPNRGCLLFDLWFLPWERVDDLGSFAWWYTSSMERFRRWLNELI